MKRVRVQFIAAAGEQAGRSRAKSASRRGWTLLEVSICTLLVGLVLASAMQAFGSVLRSRASISDRARAVQLAGQLLTEILDCRYIDEGASPLFGPEATEVGTTRTLYDDVDDYNGWSETPPKDKTGTTLPNLTGWQREVVVEWVDPANPATVSLTDQNVKRVTVTVKKNSVVLGRQVALRTRSY